VTLVSIGKLRDLVYDDQLRDDDQLRSMDFDRFEIVNKDGQYVGYIDIGDDAGVWI
jgi:hypothetical protein